MTMKTEAYFPWRPTRKVAINTPKNEWVVIKRPQRFLYHLTLKGSCYDSHDRFMFRLNYAVDGLRGQEWGYAGVWANQCMNNIHSLWPIAIDGYEAGCNLKMLKLLLKYDIWRIDTSLVDNKWYIDPNLMGEPQGRGRASDYLFTEQTVHPRGLSLYQFYINEYEYLYVDACKANYSLVPVTAVTEFIFHKWRRPCSEE